MDQSMSLIGFRLPWCVRHPQHPGAMSSTRQLDCMEREGKKKQQKKQLPSVQTYYMIISSSNLWFECCEQFKNLFSLGTPDFRQPNPQPLCSLTFVTLRCLHDTALNANWLNTDRAVMCRWTINSYFSPSTFLTLKLICHFLVQQLCHKWLMFFSQMIWSFELLWIIQFVPLLISFYE